MNKRSKGVVILVIVLRNVTAVRGFAQITSICSDANYSLLKGSEWNLQSLHIVSDWSYVVRVRTKSLRLDILSQNDVRQVEKYSVAKQMSEFNTKNRNRYLISSHIKYSSIETKCLFTCCMQSKDIELRIWYVYYNHFYFMRAKTNFSAPF